MELNLFKIEGKTTVYSIFVETANGIFDGLYSTKDEAIKALLNYWNHLTYGEQRKVESVSVEMYEVEGGEIINVLNVDVFEDVRRLRVGEEYLDEYGIDLYRLDDEHNGIYEFTRLKYDEIDNEFVDVDRVLMIAPQIQKELQY